MKLDKEIMKKKIKYKILKCIKYLFFALIIINLI